MRTYDVKCPCCGHKNRRLYLEETGGWLECEKCGVLAVACEWMRRKIVPAAS